MLLLCSLIIFLSRHQIQVIVSGFQGVPNSHDAKDRVGLWDPSKFPFLCLINGDDPNHLLTGMILQAERKKRKTTDFSSPNLSSKK